MRKPSLKYFTPSEFGIWYPLMDNELLSKLDRFRELMGSPVTVSPVEGALGRHGGQGDTSQHNVDMWGTVKAIDVFPTINGLPITTAAQRQFAYDKAIEAGFTGVGLYTDTSPSNMMHLDVRKADTLAKWSRINGDYLAISEALV